MKQAHLLFNPASGSFSTAGADRIRRLLHDAGIAAAPLFPHNAEAAEAEIRRISRAEATPLFIAAGGDGTVNTLINGVNNPASTMGYIPMGTANVLGRELGMGSWEAAVARIRNGTPRPATVGRVSSPGSSRLFMLMAGVGFDGAVVADVRPGEKRVMGKGAYLLSALRRLMHWDPSPITVTIEGEKLACHSLIACNGAHYGGDFRLAPGADIFSPQLEVVGISPCTRRGFTLWALGVILTGRVVPGRCHWTRRATHLTVDGTKALQIDGDPAGFAPLTITALPDFIRILI